MLVNHILVDKGGEVVTVDEKTRVADLIDTLREKRIGAVLVTGGGTGTPIVGVVSERDVVRGLSELGARVLDCMAGEIMTSPVVTCTPETTVAEAMGLMTTRRIRHLPVMNGGTLAGLVSIGDLVKRRIEESEQEAEALKTYIAHA